MTGRLPLRRSIWRCGTGVTASAVHRRSFSRLGAAATASTRWYRIASREERTFDSCAHGTSLAPSSKWASVACDRGRLGSGITSAPGRLHISNTTPRQGVDDLPAAREVSAGRCSARRHPGTGRALCKSGKVASTPCAHPYGLARGGATRGPLRGRCRSAFPRAFASGPRANAGIIAVHRGARTRMSSPGRRTAWMARVAWHPRPARPRPRRIRQKC